MHMTQIEAAKKGIVTPQMEIVAKKENIDVEVLRERIARGTVVIPANKKSHRAVPGGHRRRSENQNQRQPRHFRRLPQL